MNLNLKRNWYAVTCSVPVLTASTMDIQTEGMLRSEDADYFAVKSKRGGYKIYGTEHIFWCFEKNGVTSNWENYPLISPLFNLSIAEITALK